MKILIAGATGLVGSALSRFLEEKGHQVVKLSRKPGADRILWDPDAGSLNIGQLENFDAMINLAGENIADGRWTPAKKKAILESRVKSALLLAKGIHELKNPPTVFINASAVGFYGDQQDKIVDESSPAGTGFLADVCAQWEAAAMKAKREGLRVVLLRIGVVLSRHGGALANMLFPFKWGLGGRIGSGKQYMSWISLHELVLVIDFILRNQSLEGPVNAVGPCPTTNIGFTKVLGKVLKRPTILPLPAAVARLVFGELADELLLAGTRVHPTKLQKAGYSFSDPYLESTLQKEIRYCCKKR